MDNVLEKLEPLAKIWREKHIPILRIDSAKWLLDLITKEKPKRILELGTAVGYSGTILSSCGAELVTIDTDASALKIAENTFATFGVNAQIIEEDAVEALKDISTLGLIPGDFDLIFIDHAKAKYLDVLEYCISLSRTGTVIVADNVKNPKCANYLASALKHPRLKTSIIDIDEGLSFSVVK